MVAMMNDPDSTLSEDEIADEVLGSDYVFGLGYGPKPGSSKSSSRTKAQLEEALKESVKKQIDLEARVAFLELLAFSRLNDSSI
jgi:hypothetical protein